MKNFMKKTAFAALAALMALSAVSCGKTADGDGAETTAAQSGAAKAEPIVVQTNAYFAPFEYFEGNDIVGVDIDIMNKVAEKMNTTVEFQNVDFSVIVDNVSAGKLCDCGAAGITITEPRKQQVDFSVPYYESIQYVIYKEGTVNTTKAEDGTEYILWNDLAGKKIGVQQDTTGDIFVSDEVDGGVLADTGSERVKYDNAQLAVDAIGANQIDAVVVDKLPATYIVSKNSDYVALPLYYKGEDGAADSATSEQYAICVTKGKTELLDSINSVLNKMIADVDANGENAIDKLVAKHFNVG